ncbi:MAG: hypothetical protein LZF60_340175 [Nitrospira sp.]|nr:MAG: hypothetical protein LZF60_340175 [Nitrospira sp.]
MDSLSELRSEINGVSNVHVLVDSCSVMLMMVESLYSDLGASILQSAQPDFSHSSVTISDKKPHITGEIMAEGARFELADRLPHLRFSRPRGDRFYSERAA